MNFSSWIVIISIPPSEQGGYRVEIAFWLSCIVILYVYAGYPAILALYAGVRGRRPGSAVEFLPSVSIVLPVFNEGGVIREKLANLFELDYPAERCEILVVSDNSTDDTHQIVREFEERGVKLHCMAERKGKGAGLNLGVEMARNDIIVFTDASIMLERESLRRIVQPMIDETVGCVSGEDSMEGAGGEGAYGKYELFLRNLESRASSIVGASGCFYAQRKELVVPFLPGMAPDFLSVLVTVRKGFRAITEPAAVGWMKAVQSGREEFPRKVRTLLRGMTTLLHFRGLMNPLRHGMFAVELMSHKILRWSIGVFMVLALAANVTLTGSPFYLAVLIVQMMFYLLAIVGWKGPRVMAQASVFRIPYFFCLVNCAALVAWIRFFSGDRLEIWEPSRR